LHRLQTYLSGWPLSSGELPTFVDERGGIRLEPGGPQPSFIALLVSG
jgi:hypothetical protein